MYELRDPWSNERRWLQEVAGSPGLVGWLAEQDVSLAFTSYQTGKLFLVGHVIPRPASTSTSGSLRPLPPGLEVSGEHCGWRPAASYGEELENLLPPESRTTKDVTGLYIPKMEVHHRKPYIRSMVLPLRQSGRVVFTMATMFSCLATLHERASFTPLVATAVPRAG